MQNHYESFAVRQTLSGSYYPPCLLSISSHLRSFKNLRYKKSSVEKKLAGYFREDSFVSFFFSSQNIQYRNLPGHCSKILAPLFSLSISLPLTQSVNNILVRGHLEKWSWKGEMQFDHQWISQSHAGLARSHLSIS